MSVSTDATICYGFLCEEDAKFPWDNDVYEWDLQLWWRQVQGYVPSHPLYRSDGNYLPGLEPTKEQEDAYWSEVEAWDAAHPFPVDIVNYCSAEHPMCIIALRESVQTVAQGYAERLDPLLLSVDAAAVQRLRDFCAQYEIAYEAGDEGWWLSSYWG